MDATNNIFASTAHHTLFFTKKKAGMTSTPPFRPTTESIFRIELYSWLDAVKHLFSKLNFLVE